MTGGVFGPANSPRSNPAPSGGVARRFVELKEVVFTHAGLLEDTAGFDYPGAVSPFWPHLGITVFEVDVTWNGLGNFDLNLIDRDLASRFMYDSVAADVFPALRHRMTPNSPPPSLPNVTSLPARFPFGEMAVFLETGTGDPEDITVVVRYVANQPDTASPSARTYVPGI